MKGSSEQALPKPQILTPHFLLCLNLAVYDPPSLSQLSSDWLLLTNNKTFCYYNHDPKYCRNSPLDPKIQDKKIIYHILRTPSYEHASSSDGKSKASINNPDCQLIGF